MRHRGSCQRWTLWLAGSVTAMVLLPGCAWRRETAPGAASASRADASLLPGWLSSRTPSWGWFANGPRAASSAGAAGAAAAAAPVDSQLGPTDAAALCLATAQQFEQGDRPAEAVAQYERVLALQPDAPGVSARLAVLHGRLGNHELATRHFQKALAQSPRDGRLWNDFGYHHYQNGRWSEAERAFRESCRFEPALERNHVNLGLTLAQQNRLGEAFEAFTKAVSPGAAHSNIGMVLAQQGRSAEALDAFERALEAEPHLRQTQVARAVLARESQPPTSVQTVAAPGRAAGQASAVRPPAGPAPTIDRFPPSREVMPASHNEPASYQEPTRQTGWVNQSGNMPPNMPPNIPPNMPSNMPPTMPGNAFMPGAR